MKDIRVENVKSESIQYYTVRSRVKVRTLTSLDGLLTNDACHCPEEAKSRHFVFLIDSSDSFNHYDGTPKSWSERAKAFLINFVSLDLAPNDLISIYNFSGVKPLVKQYQFGTKGVVRKSDPSLGHHFTVPFDRLRVNSISKQDKIGKIKSIESLDGSGMMWLAAHEACQFSLNAKEESILILVSDTEWDSDGLPVSIDSILNTIRTKFDRVYTANGEVTMPKAKTDPNFVLKRIAGDTFFFDDSTMIAQLDNLLRKIKHDYSL